MDNIDQIVLDEFPYPIALSYRRLLDTRDSAERTYLAIRVFHYSIRAIVFTTVIQYITTSPKILNNDDLNKSIDITLKTPRTGEWVDLLEKTLDAYLNHRDLLFMSDLYDLYWNKSKKPRKKIRTLLKKMAERENDVLAGTTNRAAIVNEVMDLLRQILMCFEFIRDYRLWFIRSIDARRLTVVVHRGEEKSIHNPRKETILGPDVSLINQGYFYLRNKQNQLMELHPLVISAEYIRDIEHHEDTGVYEEYLDLDPAKDVEMVYFMLRANEMRHAIASGSGKEAISLFQVLLTKLSNKQKAFTKPVESVLEYIRTQSLAHSFGQSQNALQKYREEVYVERESFDTLMATFLAAEEPILVVSGNLGVGKTSLLLHFYLKELQERANVITLWFEGANMKPDIGLARLILAAWNHLDFEPAIDDIAATSLLKRIIERDLSNQQLVLLIDGVNENTYSMPLFGQINDFAFAFQAFKMIKIVVTTRSQVWQQARSKHLRTRYKAYNYFCRLPDSLQTANLTIENDSFVIMEYDHNQLEMAYKKYTAFYAITTSSLSALTPSVQNAMREPLQLSFICETHKGNKEKNIEGHIPENKRADAIIGDLIDSYTKDPAMNLDIEDFTFLQMWIVPLFFPAGGKPVAVLTRKMLLDVQKPVGDSGVILSLDRLITDTTEYSDHTAVNAQTQRLMDTGWLVRDGNASNYTLRFRYEYFYDYFVGKYMLERYEAADDKRLFFRELVRHLNAAPFLWGTMRNLLIFWIEKTDITNIEQFGYTDLDLQRDLVLSVVTYYYDLYPDQIDGILKRWLKSSSEKASQISVSLAFEKFSENLVIASLTHSRESVRQLAVEQIYKLWAKEDEKNSHNNTIEILTQVASNVRIRNIIPRPKLVANSFSSLMYASFMILLRHYNNRRQYDEQSLREIQQVWKPVFDRMRMPFLIIPRRFRLSMLRLIMRGVLMPIFENMWHEGTDVNHIIDVREIRNFFPPSDEHKTVFDDLTPQLNAIVDNLSIDDILPKLEELMKVERDYMTSVGLCLFVLVAHVFNDRLGTAKAVLKLTHILIEEFPETSDPRYPTAPFWIYPLGWCLGNIRFNEIDRSEARQILLIYIEIVGLIEQHFKVATKTADGRIFRVSMLADSVAWCYELDLEIGKETLMRLIHYAIRNNDEKQILQYAKHFAETMSYQNLPQASLNALYDLVSYLKESDSRDQNWWEEFWKDIGKAIVKHGASYRDFVKDFVVKFDEQDIPQYIRLELIEMSPKHDISQEFAYAGLHFGRYALADKNSVMRDFIMNIFGTLFEHEKFEDWMVDVFLLVGNAAYGDEFIPV